MLGNSEWLVASEEGFRTKGLVKLAISSLEVESPTADKAHNLHPFWQNHEMFCKEGGGSRHDYSEDLWYWDVAVIDVVYT